MRLSDMTAEQRDAAIKRAAAQFQRELITTAPAIARVLTETEEEAQ